MEVTDHLERIVEEVRLAHAPDARTTIFDIDLLRQDGGWAVVGETSAPAAAEELHRRLGTLDRWSIATKVERLPRSPTGPRSHALVTSAIAPMVAGPNVADPTISQAVMGARLVVLREHRHWAHCRAEDGYLGWVHAGYLRRVDETAARHWQMGADGEACLSLGADLHAADGELVARLPWGARFSQQDDGSALLADGRRGTLSGEWVTESERAASFPRSGDVLVETARRWMAAPYIWGGVTPAGVDCSGLAQAVYRAHGVELPRDSDQQARCGAEVDPGEGFSDLLPGDLLFFEEEPGSVTHVTISMGGSRIIHSSLGNGGVECNDLTGELRYEQELRRIFVGARRIFTPGP